MADMTNYQCPACTGPLHYSATLGKLECEYCGSTYTVEEMEAKYGKTGDASDKQKGDTMEMQSFNCPSCGADFMSDGVTAVMNCPYCGNPQMVPGQMVGEAKPDFIIPFKVDKKGAIAALKQHYKGKKLLPKVFSDQNHIEKIQGVYVPFWLFDCTADADITYEGTNSVSHREGDYDVTVTSHYNVRRGGKVTFSKVPADASTKMPDEYMDAIEPFDYSELKEFSQVYMPGYLADKYDVTQEDSDERIAARAKQSAKDQMLASVEGYESVIPLQEDVQFTKTKAHYAMLPVWMLSTAWNGQNYLFAVNGQSGKTVGNLPIDKGRYWMHFALAFVPSLVVLLFIISTFFV